MLPTRALHYLTKSHEAWESFWIVVSQDFLQLREHYRLLLSPLAVLRSWRLSPGCWRYLVLRRWWWWWWWGGVCRLCCRLRSCSPWLLLQKWLLSWEGLCSFYLITPKTLFSWNNYKNYLEVYIYHIYDIYLIYIYMLYIKMLPASTVFNGN